MGSRTEQLRAHTGFTSMQESVLSAMNEVDAAIGYALNCQQALLQASGLPVNAVATLAAALGAVHRSVTDAHFPVFELLRMVGVHAAEWEKEGEAVKWLLHNSERLKAELAVAVRDLGAAHGELAQLRKDHALLGWERLYVLAARRRPGFRWRFLVPTFLDNPARFRPADSTPDKSRLPTKAPKAPKAPVVVLTPAEQAKEDLRRENAALKQRLAELLDADATLQAETGLAKASAGKRKDAAASNGAGGNGGKGPWPRDAPEGPTDLCVEVVEVAGLQDSYQGDLFCTAALLDDADAVLAASGAADPGLYCSADAVAFDHVFRLAGARNTHSVRVTLALARGGPPVAEAIVPAGVLLAGEQTLQRAAHGPGGSVRETRRVSSLIEVDMARAPEALLPPANSEGAEAAAPAAPAWVPPGRLKLRLAGWAPELNGNSGGGNGGNGGGALHAADPDYALARRRERCVGYCKRDMCCWMGRTGGRTATHLSLVLGLGFSLVCLCFLFFFPLFAGRPVRLQRAGLVPDPALADTGREGAALFDLLEVTEGDLQRPAFTLQDMMDLTVLHTRQMQQLNDLLECVAPALAPARGRVFACC